MYANKRSTNSRNTNGGFEGEYGDKKSLIEIANCRFRLGITNIRVVDRVISFQ